MKGITVRDRLSNWMATCGLLMLFGFLMVTLQPSAFDVLRVFALVAFVAAAVAAWFFWQRHQGAQAQPTDRQWAIRCGIVAFVMLVVALLNDETWRGVGTAIIILAGMSLILLRVVRGPAKKPG